MTTSERRKICCSVTFHIIAVTCVVWSLYVLIDRTAEEIKQGNDNGKNMPPSLLLLWSPMMAPKVRQGASDVAMDSLKILIFLPVVPAFCGLDFCTVPGFKSEYFLIY